MTMKRSLWIIAGVIAVILAVTFIGQISPQTKKSQPSDQSSSEDAGQSKEASSPTQTPQDPDNKFAAPNPDHAQAPSSYQPAGHDHQEITEPKTPTPDQQDAGQVAEAWLTVFHSRKDHIDDSWQKTGKNWVTPDMMNAAKQMDNGAIEGKTPTAVSKVEIKGNVEDWGIDTPVRWAHYVEVTVKTADDGDLVVKTRVRQQLTDQGWRINASTIDSWQAVKE